MSLTIDRYLSKNKPKRGSVYDTFAWENRDVDIMNDQGEKLFTQKGVEFPISWSPLAGKITASKYFFGEQGTSEREQSVRQLVGRVSEKLKNWAIKSKYFSQKQAEVFRDEVACSSLAQLMSFNSPVWFNVGVDGITGEGGKDNKESYIIGADSMAIQMPIGKERSYPQTSACFIQSVEDTMESIMELAKKEALLFKYGSGTGTNLSSLRSSREKLSGGGRPSGPLAYWTFYDKVAGIVKSGGKTRRAAKMDILDISHPDILEFIESKMREEKKARILMDNGINYKEAQETVAYQNTNISVRATDEFMQAVEQDREWKTTPVHNKEMADKMPKYKSKNLLKKIAEATHFCGDPGMQFHDTINKWHTCPNSAPIRASNPCSEYMFVDNSSCNLASLNLLAFMNEDKFDVEKFRRVIRQTAIAQDLLIDNSSYPTREIAENSHRFRPLGMGYANLGSLIMSLGLAYDSDEARAVAASLTALLTAQVYETSTEMAEKLGAFEEFGKNKEPMLKVMKMHKEALKKINRKKLPSGLENVLIEAEGTWDNVIKRGEDYGFRNSQATVLAPTGTIGFMMDCDTKGVEPEIGLVQTKLLFDGGTLKLVNGTVTRTLKKLNYSEEQIKDILEYVKQKETMEGAPYVKEEHLSVFDCSNKPSWAKRTIAPRGHLEMMAAVQPFISGAISKTVNLPKEASIEEIEQIYMNAWKLGLKAVALYRDGSKAYQPLSFTKKEITKPIRRKLPDRRNSITQKFNISEHEGYLTVGLYEDKTPGELFANMSKEGSTVGGLMDTIGILTSFALQYGVPLDALVKKLRHQRFEPSGLVFNDSRIKTASSIPDYIAQFLEVEFLNPNKENESNPATEKKDNGKIETLSVTELGSLCPACGSQMIKRGHCIEKCKCGYESANGCGG